MIFKFFKIIRDFFARAFDDEDGSGFKAGDIVRVNQELELGLGFIEGSRSFASIKRGEIGVVSLPNIWEGGLTRFGKILVKFQPKGSQPFGRVWIDKKYLIRVL